MDSILWEPTRSDFTWICICPACWVTSPCESIDFSETPFFWLSSCLKNINIIYSLLVQWYAHCVFVCPFVDLCVCGKLESCGRFRRFGIYSMSVRFSWLDSKLLHSQTLDFTQCSHFYLEASIYDLGLGPCTALSQTWTRQVVLHNCQSRKERNTPLLLRHNDMKPH